MVTLVKLTAVSPTSEWVLLAYRMPREPSSPRISVWRKLRRLGAVQLLDNLVGLPGDARTRERLEWIADEVVAAGGEASIWLAHPASKAHERALAAHIANDVEAAYVELIDAAAEAARDATGARKRTAARLRRELNRIRQRDHFPKRGFERASAAIERLEAGLADDARVIR
jgi:Protein ChrB, N-terminal